MRRICGILLLACALAPADPGSECALLGEAEIFDRWPTADPEARRHMSRRLAEIDAARRFSDARPVLVAFGRSSYPLAEIFRRFLDPALELPLEPQNVHDLGLTQEHRVALGALEALRASYAPPQPVRAGTLNLLLDYAYRALTAHALPPTGRLRFFSEVLRNVRALDGRVRPDRRTRWLVHARLLPELLGLARRTGREPAVGEAVSEAASLLYLPSILDERAQALLAPLTRGGHSRRILRRAYRQGALDSLGLVAMARSVTAQTRDDPAFAAGAPPLILELLSDPDVPARERGELLDAVLLRIAPIEPLRETAVDLLAAGFGGPPSPLEAYEKRRAEASAPVPVPRWSGNPVRFLSVVMVDSGRGAAPEIARVVRADTAPYTPIHKRGAVTGRTAFLGVLVPAPGGEHADFLGPPPGLSGARDNRLLRRTLESERIAIKTFGARGEVLELSVALPEDASEPVPVQGAGLGHILELIEGRLRRTADETERVDLIQLLGRLGTNEARRLAAEHARTPPALAALLPLVDGGDVASALAVVTRLGELPLGLRERALASALRTRDPAVVKKSLHLCAVDEIAVAALAADALLATGNAEGLRALLRHDNPYGRAAGTSLALRLTPLAGNLRISIRGSVGFEEIAGLCRIAFDKEQAEPWKRYGKWIKDAFRDPERVRALRTEFRHIKLRDRVLSPSQFADYCLGLLAREEFRKYWGGLAPYVLAPYRPGRGMPDALLQEVLDAFEGRLEGDRLLRRAWVDSLVLLACAQYGMEADVHFLDLVHERLSKIAGESAPSGAKRKPGIFWPIWAAGSADR
ncbi:MAG: hypothetical protein ACYTGV_03585 [Planctomycetota bacterium]|jgi:hypothetical protein